MHYCLGEIKIFVVGLRIGEEMCVFGSKCHFCMFRAITLLFLVQSVIFVGNLALNK